MAAEKRTSKMWKINPRLEVTEFNLEDITKDNFINHLLVLKQSDISYSFMMQLFGSFEGNIFCHPYDTFEVPEKGFSFTDKKGKVHYNTNAFTTTIGIWIFNIFFINGFGLSDLFGGYINAEINAKSFKAINQKLVYALMENKVDIEVYKNFLDYTQFFMPYETILSSNHTEKVLEFSKVVEKKKKELFNTNKEALAKGDIAVAEKIEKELVAFAKEYLKDDPGLDAYISGAGGNMDNNFKNMYIMKGAVRDPDPNAKQEFNIMESNFFNGVSADEYTLLANSLAAGPYARAKKTEQGGYWEKLFGAALGSITLDEPGSDCGTDKYITVTLTEKNINEYIYNYIIKSNGELEELTSDNINSYIGKTVKMRFSIFCKSKTGICNKCAGNLFVRRNSKNIGLACMEIPSTLKRRSMKSFHNSTIKTSEIDPMKAFGLK